MASPQSHDDHPPIALSVRAVAKGISLSASTVRRLIDQGELPAVRIGHRVLVLQADLDTFIERLKAAA